MYSTIYRNVLFPFFEGTVKRRQTLKFWEEAERSQWWPGERLHEHQLLALKQLLRHAYETCPYYHDRWKQRGLHPSDLNRSDDLANWPLLTRSIIRSHRQALRSTVPFRLLTKGTGGSSGEPLQFDVDTESHERRTAMMYRGYNWAGGGPGTKQLHLWGTAVGSQPRWQRYKSNLHARFDRKTMVSCFDFTPQRMRTLRETWNRLRPEVVVAYTSPLFEWARFLEAERLEVVPPRSIIVGAEKLHDFQRMKMKEVFQAPVFETYGSREFMLIGAECDRHTGLHLTMENLIVEVVDNNGRPVPPGTEGNVAITDLFNYGMPFIRYLNGDRAIAGFESCSCGRGLPILRKVVGRQLDILVTPSGRQLPGEFFPHLLKDFSGIRRFQVIQPDPNRIILKIVPDDTFTAADRALLLLMIEDSVAGEMDICIDIVDEIPLTNAGKLRVVVREFASDECSHRN